ncbi:MAG: S41 family peptidase [Bacteroidota bacterium]
MRLAFLLLLLFPAAQHAAAQDAPIQAESPIRSTTLDWHLSQTDAGLASALHGVWQSRGYGWVLNITPDTLTIYAAHEAGCLAIETSIYMNGPLRMYALADGGDTEAGGNEVLLSYREANSTRYVLDRIDAVPEACLATHPDDPRAIFDYVWGVMDEQYAFFDLYSIDWAARYAALAPTVANTTSDAALFDALAALIEGIEDSHLTLRGEVDGEARRAGGRAAPDLNPALRAGFAVRDTTAEDATETQGAFTTRWYFGNRDAIRDRLLAGSYETASGGNVFWGRFNGPDGRIGYVNIAGMGGFAEETEDGEDAPFEDEVAAVYTVMGRVIADLADTDAMIVDVALNQGGYDEVSLGIAAHFAVEETPGLTKYAFDAQEDTRQSFTVVPAETVYTKPVVVLTSDVTVSAAETFTMEMRALPQVTHAGSATRGALSDMLFRTLPNGWRLTLSNEVYLDTAGVLWERTGIAPEQPLPMFKGGLDGHLDALRTLADQLEAGSN